MYMHIHAMGDSVKIAKAIHDALTLSKTPFAASTAPAQTQDIGIDTKQIIEVTALHSHMLTDSPHLFFMHFWANDDAKKLARGLRAALDKVNVQKRLSDSQSKSTVFAKRLKSRRSLNLILVIRHYCD
jgi:hypothetical protein